MMTVPVFRLRISGWPDRDTDVAWPADTVRVPVPGRVPGHQRVPSTRARATLMNSEG